MIRKIGKSVEHLLAVKKNFNRLSEYEKNKINAEKFLKNKKNLVGVAACPVCRLTDLDDWCNIFGFIYQQCRNCGLVFLNPSPDSAELEKFYTSGYEVLANVNVAFDKAVSDLRINNIILPRLRFVQQFIAPGSWLDLGAGNGELVYGLKLAGDNKILVKGVEINKNSLDFAKRNYNIDLQESRLIDYLKNNNIDFDVVSMFGLLEHLALVDLQTLIEILSDKMKQGSFLVLLIPVARSYSSFLQKANNKLISRHLVPPNHITLWGEKSVDIFLKNHNFSISGIWTFGQDCFELFYQLKEFSTTDEISAMLASLPSIQKAIDNVGLSDEMLIVAKKS